MFWYGVWGVIIGIVVFLVYVVGFTMGQENAQKVQAFIESVERQHGKCANPICPYCPKEEIA